MWSGLHNAQGFSQPPPLTCNKVLVPSVRIYAAALRFWNAAGNDFNQVLYSLVTLCISCTPVVLKLYAVNAAYLLTQKLNSMTVQVISLALNVKWTSPINISGRSCTATTHTLEHFCLSTVLCISQQHLSALPFTTADTLRKRVFHASCCQVCQ